MRKQGVCLQGMAAVSVVAMLLVAGEACGEGEPLFGFRLGAVVEHLVWEEHEAGSRLLEEKGPLGGVEGELLFRMPKGTRIGLNGQLYFGSVDYDGSTQDGTPTQTDVDYSGVRWRGLLGFDLVPEPVLDVVPCLSIGGRAWRRDINDSPEGQGYVEDWLTIRAGAGLEIGAGRVDACRLHARAMALYPLYNQARYDLAEFGYGSNIEVQPGRRVTLRVEAGLRVRHFFAAVHYERLDFSPSDQEPVRGGVVWQPESEGSVTGVSLGVVF
jgi:hypothetical protein